MAGIYIQKEYISIETDKIVEEELPLEEALTEKRHKYTAKEEFVHLLYNDILPPFIIEWTGYFLRKVSLSKKSSNDDIDIVEKNIVKISDYRESDDSLTEDCEIEIKVSVSSCKLSLPDEFADIKFYNNNSYSGRIDNKMMEGVGIYTWYNGVQYKGQFERNQIQGRGLLEWSKDCWYKGDFVNGCRHGQGIMVDRGRNYVYIGKWHTNRKP